MAANPDTVLPKQNLLGITEPEADALPTNKKPEVKTQNNLNEMNSPPREAQSTRIFLVTLWTICEDPKCDDTISWNPESVNEFIIHQFDKFKEEVLPKYYSAKWNSFRRQLYFYGFKGTKDTVWRHAELDHTNPESLQNIKRVRNTTRKRRLQEAFQLAAAMSGYAQMGNPALAYQQMLMQSMSMGNLPPQTQQGMISSLPPPMSSSSVSPPNYQQDVSGMQSMQPMVMPMPMQSFSPPLRVTPNTEMQGMMHEMPQGLSMMMPNANKRMKMEHNPNPLPEF